jgi:hypothetical protein
MGTFNADSLSGKSIDENGFIFIKDGHFHNKSGRVRFFGLNMTHALFSPKEDAVEMARQLEGLGVNLLRAHYMDFIDIWGGNFRLFGNPAYNYEDFDADQLDRVDFFFSELKKRGITTVITACPSCYQVFKRYATEMEVKTIYQMLDAAPDYPSVDVEAEMCMHDPCSTRYETEVHGSVRSIVERQGISVGRLKHQGKRTLCCGEGGSASFVAPEITNQWAEQRAEQAAGRQVITYCAGCVQFFSGKMPTIHMVDLLLDPAKALAGKAAVSRSPFTYFNRLLLKFKLGT